MVPLHFLCELFCADVKESYLSYYLMTWRRFITVGMIYWKGLWPSIHFLLTSRKIFSDSAYNRCALFDPPDSPPFFKHFLPLILEADTTLCGERKPRGGRSVARSVCPTVLTSEPRTSGSLVPDGFVFVSQRKRSHCQRLPQSRLCFPGIQMSVLRPVQGHSYLESRCA